MRKAEVRGPGEGWDVILVVAAGGALGSLSRWGIGQVLTTQPRGFPWSTFLVNVSGAFAMGVLMVFVLDVWPPSRLVQPFLGVGILGGFTTVSTYLLDTRALIAADQELLAATYLFGTLTAGLAAVWVGIVGARMLTRRLRS